MLDSMLIGAVLLMVLSGCECWVFTELGYRYDPSTRQLLVSDTDNSIDGEDPRMMQGRLSLIFPGTLWCGAGDIASGYDDLGSAAEADRCCRAHDHCPDVIHAGESAHNLTNTAFYTRLSCECDEGFRSCLHAAAAAEREAGAASVAPKVGALYFDGLGTRCFRQDHPSTGCRRRGGLFHLKCLEYTYNTSQDKVYQWFDVPPYNH